MNLSPRWKLIIKIAAIAAALLMVLGMALPYISSF